MSDEEGRMRNQVDRGEEARKIIENSLFNEAFADLERGIMDVFKESGLSDEKLHRHARESLGLLANLRQCLEQHMITGKAAHTRMLTLKEKGPIARLVSRV
mgnify:CR=1 FL=1|tara:strand:- start:6220 stop:6522 length:303 start_codon:yes stop_codon:yes gene_type:complete